MAKLFRKKDGSAVVKGTNGKIVNNLPAPPSLIAPNLVQNIPNLGSPQVEQPANRFSAILESARVPSYISETAKITPVNNGELPLAEDVEIEYWSTDLPRDLDYINRKMPPKVYSDNLNWEESYLLNVTTPFQGGYDTLGLQHYGGLFDDEKDRLTLQAVLTKNVNTRLSTPAFQGADSSDPTPYLVVTKDIQDIAKTIKADKSLYSEEEVAAAERILDSIPTQENWGAVNSDISTGNKLNDGIVSNRYGTLKFTKEADLVLRAGERAISLRSEALEVIKEEQQKVLESRRAHLRRGGLGGTYRDGDENFDSYSLSIEQNHRMPSASRELAEVRNEVINYNSAIRVKSNSLPNLGSLFSGKLPKIEDVKEYTKKREEVKEQVALLVAEKATILKRQALLESKAGEAIIWEIYFKPTSYQTKSSNSQVE